MGWLFHCRLLFFVLLLIVANKTTFQVEKRFLSTFFYNNDESSSWLIVVYSLFTTMKRPSCGTYVANDGLIRVEIIIRPALGGVDVRVIPSR